MTQKHEEKKSYTNRIEQEKERECEMESILSDRYKRKREKQEDRQIDNTY